MDKLTCLWFNLTIRPNTAPLGDSVLTEKLLRGFFIGFFISKGNTIPNFSAFQDHTNLAPHVVSQEMPKDVLAFALPKTS